MSAKWTDRLVALNACGEAVEWAEGFTTAEEAWNACDRGDWMLWWLGKGAGPPWSESRRPLVGAAAMCATLAPTTGGEHELVRAWAIGCALRWAEGEDCAEELAHAAHAAHAAADAADAADAAAAADAAYAAYAAAYAAYAAAVAARHAMRARIRAECADIVREWFPNPPGGKP